MSDRECPDGGTCHHECSPPACFRVKCCGPLSGVYPRDEWPADIRTRHGYDAPARARADTVDLATVDLYAERAQCVIALARAAQAMGCCVGFRNDPDLDDGGPPAQRPVLFIELPTGQVSWHLTVANRLSAPDIGDYIGEWDRHDTAEKYRRLAAHDKSGLPHDVGELRAEIVRLRAAVLAVIAECPLCSGRGAFESRSINSDDSVRVECHRCAPLRKACGVGT